MIHDLEIETGLGVGTIGNGRRGSSAGGTLYITDLYDFWETGKMMASLHNHGTIDEGETTEKKK